METYCHYNPSDSHRCDHLALAGCSIASLRSAWIQKLNVNVATDEPGLLETLVLTQNMNFVFRTTYLKTKPQK